MESSSVTDPAGPARSEGAGDSAIPAPAAGREPGWRLGAYFLLLLGLFVAVAGAAAVYVSVQTQRDAKASALTAARFAARAGARALAKDVGTLRATVSSLAANPQLAQVFSHPKGCTLTFSGSGTLARGHIEILRPDGRVACTSRTGTAARPGASYANARWLPRARRGSVLLAPVSDAPSGGPAVLAASPIPTGGVVAAFGALTPAGAQLAAMFRGGRPAEFLVTTGDGATVLARSIAPVRSIGARTAGTPFVAEAAGGNRRDIDGTPRLYASTTVPGLGWKLYVGEDKTAALAPGIALRNRELAIIVGGLLVVLLAALLVYRRIALPIKRLAAAVQATDPYDPAVAALAVAGPAEIAALSADIDGLVATVGTELTARRRLEEQLRHTQKMDALGRVAAGVAHDFNNLVTVIAGFTSLILKSARDDEQLRSHAEQVGRAAERAAVLIRQLLVFSRRESVEPTTLDLNDLVGGMQAMLRRLLGEKIELAADLRAEPAAVSADRGRLEQVLMNLAVNARDAMPAGGTLTFASETVELGPAAADALALDPGAYVVLGVSDTGTGMDARTLARLFEPFFTTKPAGEGTGLGLATCYGIVSELGGKIAVSSELGRGSRFEVYLRVAAASTDDAAAAPLEEPPAGAGKTVLVVEDDPDLRALTKTVLEGAGYAILEARFGEEAIWVAEQHEAPIDLLLTDSVMPVMSGRELADRLLGLHRETAVVYMSGYERDAHPGEAPPEDAFLAKPFTPDALLGKVRAALE
jgi:signal transduction histidine kinase